MPLVYNEITSTLPSGTYGRLSRVNNQWFAMGAQSTQADYFAVSADGVTWTKYSTLPVGGVWSTMQYQNGIYVTQTSNIVASSVDLINWSIYNISTPYGGVFGANGIFLIATASGIFSSTNAVTWTQRASFSNSSSASWGYINSRYFVKLSIGMLVSSDGINWTSNTNTSFFNGIGPSYDNILSGAVVSNSIYFGKNTSGITGDPVKLIGNSWSNINIASSTGGGQIATDGTRLVYYDHNGIGTSGSSAKIWTAVNDTLWTERLLPESLAYGRRGSLFYSVLAGHYILIVEGTNKFFSSSDGTTWTVNNASFVFPTQNTNSFTNFINDTTYAALALVNGQIVFRGITFDNYDASPTPTNTTTPTPTPTNTVTPSERFIAAGLYSTNAIKVQLQNLISCHRYKVFYKLHYTRTDLLAYLDKESLEFTAQSNVQNAFVILTKNTLIDMVLLEVKAVDLDNGSTVVYSSFINCDSFDSCIKEALPSPTPTPTITPGIAT